MAAEIRLKIRFLPDGLNQEFECSIFTQMQVYKLDPVHQVDQKHLPSNEKSHFEKPCDNDSILGRFHCDHYGFKDMSAHGQDSSLY